MVGLRDSGVQEKVKGGQGPVLESLVIQESISRLGRACASALSPESHLTFLPSSTQTGRRGCGGVFAGGSQESAIRGKREEEAYNEGAFIEALSVNASKLLKH